MCQRCKSSLLGQIARYRWSRCLLGPVVSIQVDQLADRQPASISQWQSQKNSQCMMLSTLHFYERHRLDIMKQSPGAQGASGCLCWPVVGHSCVKSPTTKSIHRATGANGCQSCCNSPSTNAFRSSADTDSLILNLRHCTSHSLSLFQPLPRMTIIG